MHSFLLMMCPFLLFNDDSKDVILNVVKNLLTNERINLLTVMLCSDIKVRLLVAYQV